jgi:hypothetical protein
VLSDRRPLPHRIPVRPPSIPDHIPRSTSKSKSTPHPEHHLTYSVSSRAAIVDYFPPKRVPKFRTTCNWLLRAFTLTTAVGLYEFETNDVGVTEALRRIWTA